jgi:hypothetical protein
VAKAWQNKFHPAKNEVLEIRHDKARKEKSSSQTGRPEGG